MDNSPLVSIVVLNYNNWKDTIECLESIYKLNYSNFKVFLIDNNSNDGSVDKLIEYLSKNKTDNLFKMKWNYKLIRDFNLFDSDEYFNLFFLISQQNKGYASGNNIGIKFSNQLFDSNFFWILNNDTVLDKDSLKSLVDYFNLKIDKGVKLGLLGSKLIFYYFPTIIQCVAGKYRSILGFPKQIGIGVDVDNLNEVDEDSIDYVSGASVFVSREFINDVGLMSEDYFLYFEELDWAKRALICNYKFGYCNESLVYHKDGASTKEEIKGMASSAFSDYHFTLSKIVFSKKFYKNRLPLIYFSFCLVMINRIRKGHFKNISSIIRAVLGLKYVK